MAPRTPSPRPKARPRSTTDAGARLEALGGDNRAVVVDRCTRPRAPRVAGYPLTQRPGGHTKASRCGGLFRQHISWAVTALLGQFQPQIQQTGFASRAKVLSLGQGVGLATTGSSAAALRKWPSQDCIASGMSGTSDGIYMRYMPHWSWKPPGRPQEGGREARPGGPARRGNWPRGAEPEK
jgi:hypothetical protein